MDFKRSDESDPTWTYDEYNFETVSGDDVCDKFKRYEE